MGSWVAGRCEEPMRTHQCSLISNITIKPAKQSPTLPEPVFVVVSLHFHCLTLAGGCCCSACPTPHTPHLQFHGCQIATFPLPPGWGLNTDSLLGSLHSSHPWRHQSGPQPQCSLQRCWERKHKSRHHYHTTCHRHQGDDLGQTHPFLLGSNDNFKSHVDSCMLLP